MQSGKPGSLGLVVLCLLIVNCDKFISRGNTTENIWRRAGRLTGLLLRNCMQVSFEGPQEQFLLILQRCLERRSLVALDRCLKADVIKLASGIELVRYKNDTNQRYVYLFNKSLEWIYFLLNLVLEFSTKFSTTCRCKESLEFN